MVDFAVFKGSIWGIFSVFITVKNFYKVSLTLNAFCGWRDSCWSRWISSEGGLKGVTQYKASLTSNSPSQLLLCHLHSLLHRLLHWQPLVSRKASQVFATFKVLFIYFFSCAVHCAHLGYSIKINMYLFIFLIHIVLLYNWGNLIVRYW